MSLNPGKNALTFGQRNYILWVPTGYTGARALPLVFVLHGFGGDAEGMMATTGFHHKADAEGFFVAFLNAQQCTTIPDDVGACRPDPTWGVQSGATVWNTGLTPKVFVPDDDVAFVRDLLANLKTQVKIDSARVYAAGFSNGGDMCHLLGSQLSDKLAAVAAVAGTIGIQQSDCSFATIPAASRPLPIVMIHGKQDDHIPYGGGVGAGPGQLSVMSVAQAVAFWTQNDHCQGAVTTQTFTGFSVERHEGCAGGSEVELISVDQAGHVWEPLATGAIWEFFSRHPLQLRAYGGGTYAIDPLAAIADQVYQLLTLPDPPPEGWGSAIDAVVKTMTAEQRQAALTRARALGSYADALARAAAP